jgi:hypothetical protein
VEVFKYLVTSLTNQNFIREKTKIRLKSGNACSLSAQNHLSSSLLDNALDHALLLICSYLAKHQTSVVPHPPYSPDLAPTDFFLFPKLKTTSKGHCFLAVEEIKENAIRELCTVTESAFQEVFQQWKKYWEWCIASRGDYFEGDSA